MQDSAVYGQYRWRRLRTEDAAMLPEAFRQVYGDRYYDRGVYEANWLADEIDSGRQLSYAAVTSSGALAAHTALRRSAPNRCLLEISQGLVVPGHRRSGLFGFLHHVVMKAAQELSECPGVFSLALGAHPISQRILHEGSFRDLGFLVDYLPQAMLGDYGVSGPVATVIMHREFERSPSGRRVHVPVATAERVASLLRDCGLQEKVVSLAGAPAPAPSTPTVATLDSLKSKLRDRLTVRRPGSDFVSWLEELDRLARSQRIAEVVLALDTPEAAWAWELLARQGCVFSGILPHYMANGSHAAVLFAGNTPPNVKDTKPFTDTAKGLLQQIAREWEVGA